MAIQYTERTGRTRNLVFSSHVIISKLSFYMHLVAQQTYMVPKLMVRNIYWLVTLTTFLWYSINNFFLASQFLYVLHQRYHNEQVHSLEPIQQQLTKATEQELNVCTVGIKSCKHTLVYSVAYLHNLSQVMCPVVKSFLDLILNNI